MASISYSGEDSLKTKRTYSISGLTFSSNMTSASVSITFNIGFSAYYPSTPDDKYKLRAELFSSDGTLVDGTNCSCNPSTSPSTLTFQFDVSSSFAGKSITYCTLIQTESAASSYVSYTRSTGNSITYSENTRPDLRTLNYYDGSKWVECEVYYYDGSKWVQCEPNYYTGSKWA